MLVAQRWRRRRDSYRPAEEPIRTRDYEVASIGKDAPAKTFVEAHHYSGTFPAARFRVGLYRRAELVGVAVFSQPVSSAVITNVFPCDVLEAVDLGRFVLLDDVPGNGESWFLARAFDVLRFERLRGVVSFADPVPRAAADGRVITPGHIGTIYQAHNGLYLGRGTRRTLRLLPDGRVFSDRTIQKIRAGERGWRYAAAQLQAHGAPAPTGDRCSWLHEWLPRLTRTIRHPGNHRYAWPLDKRMQVQLERQPYPKRDASEAA